MARQALQNERTLLGKRGNDNSESQSYFNAYDAIQNMYDYWMGYAYYFLLFSELYWGLVRISCV
jgi:hypothetical protein